MNNVPPVQQSVRRTIEQRSENAKEMGPTSSDSSEFTSRASTPKSPTPPKLSPTNTRWREDQGGKTYKLDIKRHIAEHRLPETEMTNLNKMQTEEGKLPQEAPRGVSRKAIE